MKASLIFTTFLLFTAVCSAQNYRTFAPGHQYFYYALDDDVNAVRIDSLTVEGNDTLLHSFFTPRNTVPFDYESCADSMGASWIGGPVIIKPDGRNLFLTKYGDTVCINTLANPGESWTFLSDTNGNVVEATVVDISSHSFLGITDSVKTIDLAVITDGTGISQFLAGQTIILSKNYGLIQTINFYFVPDYQDMWSDVAVNYSLIGLDDNGQSNITAVDIYNYDIGDEFHTSLQIIPYGGVGSYLVLTINKILDKTEYPSSDSVTYKKHRFSKIISDYYVDSLELIVTDISYLNDTLDMTIDYYSTENMKLNFFPNESYPTNEFYDRMNMKITSEYNGRPFKHNEQLSPAFNGNCYMFDLLVGYNEYAFYIDGCGGKYYYSNGDMGYSENFLPEYFYKNGETWGTPFDEGLILGTDQPEQSKKLVSTYPNPSVGNITFNTNFENNEEYSLHIYDISGKKVFTENNIRKTGYVLKRKNLQSGLYIYKIVTIDGSSYNGKIVLK